MTHLSGATTKENATWSCSSGACAGGITTSRLRTRALDLALVIAMLPIVLPLSFLIALALALTTGTPFSSRRMTGRDGRSYRAWRLRSSAATAEISGIEAFVRKSRLDELPLLIAVVTGHESLFETCASA